MGKDFDFFGSTSRVTNAINEEAIRFNRQQSTSKPSSIQPSPPKQTTKQFKTGYEAYKNPTYIPELQVDASLWGTNPSTSTRKDGGQSTAPIGLGAGAQQRVAGGVPAKKMMSLEEVEAAMRAQPKKPNPAPQTQTQAQIQNQSPFAVPQMQEHVAQSARLPPQQAQMLQRQSLQSQQHYLDRAPSAQPSGPPPMTNQPRSSQLVGQHAPRSSQILQDDLPTYANPISHTSQAVAPAQMLQRGQTPLHQTSDVNTTQQPRQILQNPNRLSGQFTSRQAEPPAPMPSQHRGSMSNSNGAYMPLPVIYHPSQIMNLTEEERNAYLIEEAKRAKRNHKIFLLSKGNGLMTPQDKNFITRIQLQQLMTATGNVNEQDPDVSLSEDFYYQVFNQIENRPRQNPQQPLNNFAQTYLFRTGGRQGILGRRHRGGDSHMQRMEQQVQRAVEAAKAKPKNKQLVLEGSLGKISFSNAKTPKPLLNIKRQDVNDVTGRSASRKGQQAALSTTDRKTILKNIEAVYSTLMKMEDHDRQVPPSATENIDPVAMQAIQDWQQDFHLLNQKLWADLKVTEPIMPDSAILHPFIAFLSYPKGKKAIPRIFNHIDENQRLTILTLMMVHLDILDVIRLVQPLPNGAQPSSMIREQVDLFLQAVMPSLFSYVIETPLTIVIGLLGLVIERVSFSAVVRSRVGLEILTMFLSRAAIIKANETPDDQTWDQWLSLYNAFFDLVEPVLGEIFPTSVNAGQDQYVWQFLAATGSGANPEQQQRLVLSVK